MKKIIQSLAVLYICILAFFCWGYATGKYKIFPFKETLPFVHEIESFFTENHHESISDIITLKHQEIRTEFNFSGLKIVDKNFIDNGYLLISRYSWDDNQVVIELLDIDKDKVIYKWIPDVDAILAATPNHTKGTNTKMAFRSQHPLLLPHGNLIIGSGEGPLAKIDSCGNLVWAIDRYFHHTIELDSEGMIVAPYKLENGPDRIFKKIGITERGTGIALISPDGKVVKEYTITEALVNSGYRGLVLGVGRHERDVYHLNDAQPLPGKRASEGLLLSLRHLSTIALFVPARNEIEWVKTGPWLLQHDVNVVSDNVLSVFGNNVMRGVDRNELLNKPKEATKEINIFPDDQSDVYLFDVSSGEIRTPFTKILKKTDFKADVEGRLRILANGDAFLEETPKNRLLRVSPSGVRWEYVNANLARGTTGSIHWTRYLNPDEVDLSWLSENKCN